MNIQVHTVGKIDFAEVIAEEMVIATAEDALDLLGNLYYQGFDRMIVHEENIVPEFFDLKTGMAGEVLQKFSNYRVKLAIVGDFSKYASKSLQDFIFESNKQRQVCFVRSVEEGMETIG